jgi:hypothetical protein
VTAKLTLKGGKDWDAPWAVLEGDSIGAIYDEAQGGVFQGAVTNAINAIVEANALANVKATLGATEMPTPPVATAAFATPGAGPATKGQRVVLGKLLNKTDGELGELTSDEAAQKIKEARDGS